MFAPQSSPAGRFEGQNHKTKDVVFCERSLFPLAVPSALVAAIWDQINEGLRAVPRGGAEVGGLLLGRQSQTGIVLAEEFVPIQIEYRFGPSFRLSDIDLKGIQSSMASIQKDPSKAVVGFYRSRTRNDSRSQESDSELLAVLEQAHTSFTSNFHYYIAFTPLSKMSMTASISVRKDDGWDDWQHVTLRSNPLSASEPIEFETPPTVSPTPAATLAQPPTRASAAPLPVAHSEPRAIPHPEPYAPPQPPPRALAHSEPRSPSHSDWMPAASPAAEPASRIRQVPASWLIGGAVLLAVIGVSAYLHFSTPQQPRLTFPITAAVPGSPTVAAVRIGFSAAPEGPLWRLTWDRAAVAALNPTGAVLAIRDGGKEQQVGLTPSDLSSGTILYTPQTSDLLFSLNIVMPGSQVAEEHIRVLEAPRAEAAGGFPGGGGFPAGGGRGQEPGSGMTGVTPSEPRVKIVVRDQVRTLRPFTPATNGPGDSSSAKSALAEMPPPPTLPASTNSPLSSALPIAPTPMAAAPAPRDNRQIPVNTVPVVPAPLRPLSTPGAPAPVTVGPKVVRRISPSFNGPLPSGASAEVQIRVQIDAQGAVAKVTPIAPNAYNYRLVEAAARAAKFWVFEPAKTDGNPVPSEMILDFHFGK